MSESAGSAGSSGDSTPKLTQGLTPLLKVPASPGLTRQRHRRERGHNWLMVVRRPEDLSRPKCCPAGIRICADCFEVDWAYFDAHVVEWCAAEVSKVLSKAIHEKTKRAPFWRRITRDRVKELTGG